MRARGAKREYVDVTDFGVNHGGISKLGRAGKGLVI